MRKKGHYALEGGRGEMCVSGWSGGREEGKHKGVGSAGRERLLGSCAVDDLADLLVREK